MGLITVVVFSIDLGSTGSWVPLSAKSVPASHVLCGTEYSSPRFQATVPRHLAVPSDSVIRRVETFETTELQKEQCTVSKLQQANLTNRTQLQQIHRIVNPPTVVPFHGVLIPISLLSSVSPSVRSVFPAICTVSVNIYVPRFLALL